MSQRTDEPLEFHDDGTDGTAAKAAEPPTGVPQPEAGAPAPASGRAAAATPVERGRIVREIDRTLTVIGEILDMLRQRIPRGSQTRIFVEAAITATQRARKIAESLRDER